ncbi:MAG: hypothetical protein ACYTDT_10060 [Planctomycetota bacterium]|jgi:hypothetical protein
MYSENGEALSATRTEVLKLTRKAYGEYTHSAEYKPDGKTEGELTIRMKSPTDGVLKRRFDYETGEVLSSEWSP